MSDSVFSELALRALGGVVLVSRSPEPLELFIVEPDGSNVDALLEWGSGELTSVGIRLDGGLELGASFVPGVYPKTVRAVTGCSWAGEWFSFAKADGFPTAVLGKNASGWIAPYSVSDLKSAGYAESLPPGFG